MKKEFKFVVMLIVLALAVPFFADSLEIVSRADIGEVSVEADSTDDLVTVGGKLEVKDVVEGDAVCIGGTFDINGTIDGDLVLIGSSGHIDSLTEVKGDFVLIGSSAQIDSMAKFNGEKINIAIKSIGDFVRFAARNKMDRVSESFEDGFSAASVGRMIAQFIFLSIVSLLIILLVKPYIRVENTLTANPLKVFLFGLLVEVLIIPATLFLAISLIGIPFIPLFILLVFAGMVFGWAVAVNYTGKKIAEKIWNREMHSVVNVLLGMAVISIIPLIHSILVWTNVSYLDDLFGFFNFVQNYVLITFAFGSVLLSRFGTRVFVKNESEKKNPEEVSEMQN